MAEGVVDMLEIVQVQEEQGAALVLLLEQADVVA